MRFEGQIALITGAARGAGRGVALEFAREGCDVVVLDLLTVGEIQVESTKTVAAVKGLGRRALAISCDVRSEEQLSAAVASTIETFGRLDHVVVNAGVIDRGRIDVMSVDAWRRVIDINLTGSWLTCRAVVPHLRKQGGGSITVMSSVAALRGGGEYTAYCASKAGVLGMVRALSHELAPIGVRVNAILPGYVATDMWYQSILGGTGEDDPEARANFDAVIRESVPLGRPQTIADLGQAAVYLAGATNVTGTELVVDGGRTAGP